MSQPFFQTRDLPLAIMLATCGVPFPTDEAGNTLAVFHTYDAETLRAAGLPAGMGLWDAGSLAWQRKVRGKVTYNFVQNDLLRELLAVWADHGRAMATSDAAGTSSDDIGIDVPPAVLAKAFAQYAKNQKMLAGAWRKTTPIVQTSTTDKPSATDADGRKTGTRTARAISLGASPELRRMIGI